MDANILSTGARCLIVVTLILILVVIISYFLLCLSLYSSFALGFLAILITMVNIIPLYADQGLLTDNDLSVFSVILFITVFYIIFYIIDHALNDVRLE